MTDRETIITFIAGAIVAAVLIWAPLMLIMPAGAVPNTGAATLIGSGNATIPVTAITGDTVWVMWGQGAGGECWATQNETGVIAGAKDVTIAGAPLLGNTAYYAKACDETGCGNEISFTTLPVTAVTIYNYGNAFRNITATRFNLVLISGTLFQAYTRLMPATMMFGLLFGFITLGIWDRTRSVRIIGITMMIASPFIVSSNAGLYLGIPLVEQALGQALLACGLAGILLSFIKK